MKWSGQRAPPRGGCPPQTVPPPRRWRERSRPQSCWLARGDGRAHCARKGGGGGQTPRDDRDGRRASEPSTSLAWSDALYYSVQYRCTLLRPWERIAERRNRASATLRCVSWPQWLSAAARGTNTHQALTSAVNNPTTLCCTSKRVLYINIQPWLFARVHARRRARWLGPTASATWDAGMGFGRCARNACIIRSL